MFRNIRSDSYRFQSSYLIFPYELQPGMSIAMLQEMLAKGAAKSLDSSDHTFQHMVDFGGGKWRKTLLTQRNPLRQEHHAGGIAISRAKTSSCHLKHQEMTSYIGLIVSEG